MAKIPLTQENLNALYKAIDTYFPKNGYFDGVFRYGGLSWNGLPEFLEDLSDTTGLSLEIGDKTIATAAKNALTKNFEIEQAAAKEKAEANMAPDLEADRLQREATTKASEEKAKADTEAAVKRAEKYAEQKQIINDQLAKSKAAQAELANKKIYVKVSDQETKYISESEINIYTDIKENYKHNPRAFQENLSQQIQDNLPPSVKASSTPAEIKQYADNVAAEAALDLGKTTINTEAETAIIASVAANKVIVQKITTNTEVQQTLTQAASDLTGIKMSGYMAKAGGLDIVYGQNIRSLIIGTDPSKLHVQFLDSPEGATHQLDIGKITDNYNTLLENPVFSAAQGEAKSAIFNYGREQLLTKINSIPAESTLGKIAATKEFQSIIIATKNFATFEFTGAPGFAGSFGKLVMTFSPENAPLLSAFGNLTGINFGISEIASTAAPAATQALGEGLAPMVATIGSEAVVTGAGVTATTAAVAGEAGAVGATGAAVAASETAAIGATAGSAIPVLGTIVGAVVGFVVGIVGPSVISWISDKRNKNKEMFVAIPAGIIVGLIAGPVSGIVAGVGSFGIMSVATGSASIGKAFSNAATSLLSAFSIIWATFLGAIGGPILAALIALPVLIVFILLIINSGAYLVPPGLNQTASTNPYISVQKIANPSGQLSSPTSITYTVTIAAKTDTLTGITMKAECHAQKKTGSLSCPPEQIPAAPSSISPGSPFTFTFTGNYDSKYQNALISDTITVTAKSNAGGSVKEIGSASVCFGECPLDCYNFPDTYWPNQPDVQKLKSLLTGAIAKLSGSYPDFSAKACKAGTINLCYKPGILSGGIFGFHEHGGACDIDFNTKVAAYGEEGTLFLLTHEISHHIQTISPGYFSQYMDKVNPPKTEPYICTRGALNPYESMAEGDALFVARPIIDAAAGCLTSSFQSQYPKHYTFAKTIMFAP